MLDKQQVDLNNGFGTNHPFYEQMLRSEGQKNIILFY